VWRKKQFMHYKISFNLKLKIGLVLQFWNLSKTGLVSTNLNISAIDNIKGNRVKDKSVEDFAQDFAIPDPLIKVFLGNLLQQVCYPLQCLVLQLNISLKFWKKCGHIAAIRRMLLYTLSTVLTWSELDIFSIKQQTSLIINGLIHSDRIHFKTERPLWWQFVHDADIRGHMRVNFIL
jgi:hypothetical protein